MKEFIIINNDDITVALKTINDYEDIIGAIDIESTLYALRNLYKLDIDESENAYLVGFDYNKNIIGCYQISKGTFSVCEIYRRTTAIAILLMGAKSFITVHNHPNNALYASANDLAVDAGTKTLADLIETEYLGGYIIAADGWCKIGDNGYCRWED